MRSGSFDQNSTLLSGAFLVLVAASPTNATDAIVPVEHARSISASVTACGDNVADTMNFVAYGPWDVVIDLQRSCPDGAFGNGEAEQESFIEPERIFATGVVAGSSTDPAQTCGPVSANGDSTFSLDFELTRPATVTVTASVSAFGGDTGYGQALVEFASILDLYVEGLAVDGQDDNATITVSMLPGFYSVEAWASGTVSSNCCCDVGTGEFEVDVVVHPAGDANHDLVVDLLDLNFVLQEWGPCPGPPATCFADLNRDFVVDVIDLLLVLSTWT